MANPFAAYFPAPAPPVPMCICGHLQQAHPFGICGARRRGGYPLILTPNVCPCTKFESAATAK